MLVRVGSGISGRGTSGVAIPVPPALADMVAWYRGDSLVGTLNNTATGWNDLSGNGYDMASVTNTPVIINSGQNSRLALRISQNNEGIVRASTPVIAQPFSCAIIHAFNGTPAGQEFNSLTGLFYYQRPGADYFLGSYAGGAGNCNSNVLTLGPWLLALYNINAGSSQIFIDGALNTATAQSMGTDGLTGMSIGCVGGTGMFGDIAEVIYWDKLLDAGERDELWAYVQAYYGLS